RDLFKGTLKSWKDVFNNADLKGKVSLLDDVREVTAAALKFHGYSVNTTKPEELKKAEETLLKMKSKVKMFNSDTIEALVNKEVAVAHTYSTDALQAAAQNSKIEYILPEEGGTRSIDNLVVFKSAENKKEAYALIDFMLSSEANVSFVKSIWGGPVLKETRAQLPDNVKNNKALFPTQSQISKFENLVDLGDNTRLYDELWTKIKTE
ncbi:MAG: extracellular solute-binding protein, partial [Bdellovibrionota bacterium]